MDIKPIETYYNGYNFRSRLEARWAVFFDALGIKYRYEDEGINVGDGSGYLPDFYLPQFNYHVEVKAPNEHLKEDMEKIVKAVKTGQIDNLVVLGTVPYATNDKNVFWFPAIHRSLRLCCSYDCDRVTFIDYGDHGDGGPPGICIQDDYYEGVHQPTFNLFINGDENSIDPTFVDGKDDDCTVNDYFKDQNEKVANAYKKARTARFEHGECPATLKKGIYKFKVIDFERGSFPGSQKMAAGPKAVLTLEVNTPECNARVKEDLILNKALEWKISSFFRSIGQKKVGVALKPDWTKVIGSEGFAEFEVYKNNLRVSKYLDEVNE